MTVDTVAMVTQTSVSYEYLVVKGLSRGCNLAGCVDYRIIGAKWCNKFEVGVKRKYRYGIVEPI